MTPWRRRALLAVVLATVGGGYLAWQRLGMGGLPPGIASGNDVSTKAAGRIREIPINGGDFVEADQLLARMDTAPLMAGRDAANARRARTEQLDAARSLERIDVDIADSDLKSQGTATC